MHLYQSTSSLFTVDAVGNRMLAFRFTHESRYELSLEGCDGTA